MNQIDVILEETENLESIASNLACLANSYYSVGNNVMGSKLSLLGYQISQSSQKILGANRNKISTELRQAREFNASLSNILGMMVNTHV